MPCVVELSSLRIEHACAFWFVSHAGDLTLRAYEEDCEFADPAGSFRGLRHQFWVSAREIEHELTKWEDLDLEVRTNCISSNQVYNFVICNVAMLNIGG